MFNHGQSRPDRRDASIGVSDHADASPPMSVPLFIDQELPSLRRRVSTYGETRLAHKNVLYRTVVPDSATPGARIAKGRFSLYEVFVPTSSIMLTAQHSHLCAPTIGHLKSGSGHRRCLRAQASIVEDIRETGNSVWGKGVRSREAMWLKGADTLSWRLAEAQFKQVKAYTPLCKVRRKRRLPCHDRLLEYRGDHVRFTRSR